MGLTQIERARTPEVNRQPRQYERFRCTAAECEDTCCEGWGVPVDKAAYERYQTCEDPQRSRQLKELVTINPNGTDKHFATITLQGSSCPFLSEGLCSIQRDLGEEYLAHVCATYPRVINSLGASTEQSLDLSCPEAARLILTDEEPTDFREIRHHERVEESTGEPPVRHPNFFEIRSGVLAILQNRKYSIAERMFLVGYFCDKLQETETASGVAGIPQLLGSFASAVAEGFYDAMLKRLFANATTQLMTVLGLIIARVQLDFTQPRFMALYEEFIAGLEMAPESTTNELGERYSDAHSRYYAPFAATHEYVMEQYLVHYAYKNLFPFGSETVNRFLSGEALSNPFTTHYLLMAAYYGVTKGVMTGVAARYRESFDLAMAVRCIQRCTKTFEHCSTYPQKILEVLASRGIRNAMAASVLTQDPVIAPGLGNVDHRHRRGSGFEGFVEVGPDACGGNGSQLI